MRVGRGYAAAGGGRPMGLPSFKRLEPLADRAYEWTGSTTISDAVPGYCYRSQFGQYARGGVRGGRRQSWTGVYLIPSHPKQRTRPSWS